LHYLERTKFKPKINLVNEVHKLSHDLHMEIIILLLSKLERVSYTQATTPTFRQPRLILY
jgi:hypothetical protein